MKQLSSLNLPDDLCYAATHEWARLEGDIVIIGISDYAQDQLGDVVYVELPEVGTTITKDQAFGTVESVKAVSEVYMPITGEVIMINDELADNPALVNEAPCGAGWFLKIKPADTSELDRLLSKKEYLASLAPQE